MEFLQYYQTLYIQLAANDLFRLFFDLIILAACFGILFFAVVALLKLKKLS